MHATPRLIPMLGMRVSQDWRILLNQKHSFEVETSGQWSASCLPCFWHVCVKVRVYLPR